MFFRHERPHNLTFAERLENVKRAGISVETQSGGTVLVSRGVVGALLTEKNGEGRLVRGAGVMMGGEIGNLVDGGFQKFFRTPSGKRKPALAPELKAIHDFEEDLKEALGLVSLYNESLGTVSTSYQYDRVSGRDLGVPKRPWEEKSR